MIIFIVEIRERVKQLRSKADLVFYEIRDILLKQLFIVY